MLKRNKHISPYLLALGILITQCTIIFAEYDHQFHEPDSKCAVCLVANHLSHALASTGLTLDLDHYVPLPYNETVVFLAALFISSYSIRGPPLS